MRILAAAAGMALLGTTAMAQEATTTAIANFVDAEGTEVGFAEIHPSPEGILIAIEVQNLPPETWVAFHVHETGVCDHETDHESAGGHFNPTDREHGYYAEGGPHAGDMPSQYVPADGTLRAQVFNSYLTLGDDGEADIAGRALMIHSGTDDYLTQPTGDAGGRLACGVVEIDEG